MAVKVEDVRLWTGLVASLVPAGGQLVSITVEAVAGVIRAIKKMRGEPISQEDPTAVLLATEVVGMLEAAKTPWVRIHAKAEAELNKLGPSGT